LPRSRTKCRGFKKLSRRAKTATGLMKNGYVHEFSNWHERGHYLRWDEVSIDGVSSIKEGDISNRCSSRYIKKIVWYRETWFMYACYTLCNQNRTPSIVGVSLIRPHLYIYKRQKSLGPCSSLAARQHHTLPLLCHQARGVHQPRRQL
jgi:hypothetical protein